MFQLKEHECNLKSITCRKEFHGEQRLSAMTLALKTEVNNNVLDMFDDELKEKMYCKKKKDEEDLADKGAQVDFFPVLRFDEIKDAIKWNYSGAGYRVEIIRGFSGDSNINLIKCELTDFKFLFKQDAIVEMEFNINCKPSEIDAGRIYHLLKDDLIFNFIPPSASEAAQLELEEKNQNEAKRAKKENKDFTRARKLLPDMEGEKITPSSMQKVLGVSYQEAKSIVETLCENEFLEKDETGVYYVTGTAPDSEAEKEEVDELEHNPAA